MSNERQRCSDVTPDDLDGRTVDRWPVGEHDAVLMAYEYLRARKRVIEYFPDPLAWPSHETTLPDWRPCWGCP